MELNAHVNSEQRDMISHLNLFRLICGIYHIADKIIDEKQPVQALNFSPMFMLIAFFHT